MDLTPYLRERHLKVTPQRISMLKTLNRHIHPSVDELYEEMKKDFPFISLATVYKNLNILKETGIVFEINTHTGKPKLDIRTHPHAHVLCKKCGALFDVDFTDSAYEYEKELGKKVVGKVIKFDVTITVDSCENCK
ncbi:MAG: transcriptional repressor [Campylobacteraceae bacterium]|jgi:Fur family peroxide stress response transcriptional regulator|nr:transcriptional repressor [Campylobacteraceae bacterium]